jgi:hypothetical protein
VRRWRARIGAAGSDVAYIFFTDTFGTAEVLSVYHNAGNLIASRFHQWTPETVPIQDTANSMATGHVAAAFVYRVEERVSFVMRNISPMGPFGLDPGNPVVIAQRLVRHAAQGGAFTIDVADDDGISPRAAYARGPLVLSVQDARSNLYQLAITAAVIGGGPWRCRYAGGARP